MRASTVWFVIVPQRGIENQSSIAAQSEVTQLVERVHAQLIIDQNGVYVLRWRPRRGVRSIDFRATTTVAAFAIAAPGPNLITTGPTSSWRSVSRSPGGDLLSGDYWPVPASDLVASLRVRSRGPLSVQLWNTSSKTELAARRFSSSDGRVVTLTLRTRLWHLTTTAPYAGRWPFVITPLAPPPLNEVEVRVVNVGGAPAAIFGVSLTSRAPAAHTRAH